LDITAGFEPLKAQYRFLQSEAKFRLYSGGFGSGKSLIGCREAIYHALAYPGSYGLVGRLRFKDLEATTMRTFDQLLTQMGINSPAYIAEFNKRTMTMRFSNGSEVLFSGLDDEMKLRSAEYSWIFVDEGSEVPDEIYQTLLGRLRYQDPRRLWVTTNPGASGWLRRNFVNATKPGFDHFRAPTTENHHLPQDYLDSLLTDYNDVWRERYLQGSWDVFEGQVFTMLDDRKHVIDGFTPTPVHDIYCGIDFGYRNPTAIVWLAVHKDGEEPIIVFAEHQVSEQTPNWHVRQIRAINQQYKLNEADIRWYGDPAGSQVQGLKGLSYITEYGNLGIYGIQPSTKEPSIRAMRLGKLFSTDIVHRDGKLPSIQIDRRCRQTWQSLVNYRYAEHRSLTGEDAKEQFHKHDDHLVDALGYAVMNIIEPEAKQPFRIPPGVAKPIRPKDIDDFMSRSLRDTSTSNMLGIDV
jgi:PBSX family phage terminase large subunit